MPGGGDEVGEVGIGDLAAHHAEGRDLHVPLHFVRRARWIALMQDPGRNLHELRARLCARCGRDAEGYWRQHDNEKPHGRQFSVFAAKHAARPWLGHGLVTNYGLAAGL